MANEKGTYSNPYTYGEFEVLLNEGHWYGGHVIYEGVTYYYNHEGIRGSDGCDGCNGCGQGCGEGCGEGCGCGCGEGCGCGYGCGIASGSELYQICVDDPMFALSTIVRITWGSGTFLHGSEPSLEVEYVSGTNFSFVFSWENAYRVHIYSESTAPYHFFYNIPHHYYR